MPHIRDNETMLARVEDSILVVVDFQPSVLDLVQNKIQIVNRAKFLIECAKILDVPIVITEQNPGKLGKTIPELANLIDDPRATVSKLSFSAWGERQFVKAIEHHKRAQAIILGIETHICVNQTAHDLMDEDIDAIVVSDAVSARTIEMHENGLKRMSDEGAALAHSESVVYEWLQASDHPAFRDVLALVKG